MPDPFDAYHKWLGISPKHQPPHFYRLLGLASFEDDLDVISNAADRQMRTVRTYQSGQHAAEAQKLLNQIAKASGVLLNVDRKAIYDERLRASKSGTKTSSAQPSAARSVPRAASPDGDAPIPRAARHRSAPSEPAAVEISVTNRRSSVATRYRKKKKRSPVMLVLGVIAAGLVISAGGWFALQTDRGGRPAGVLTTGETATAPLPVITDASVQSSSEESQETESDADPSRDPSKEIAISEPSSSEDAPDTLETDVALPTPVEATMPLENPVPQGIAASQEKRRVPDSDVQTRLADEVRQLYDAEYQAAASPKAMEAKVLLAAKFFDLCSDASAEPDMPFVLASQAVELALAAGDVPLAARALDLQASTYDVEPWQCVLSSIETVGGGRLTPEARMKLVEFMVEQADAAILAERTDVAETLVANATKYAASLRDAAFRKKLRLRMRRIKSAVVASKKLQQIARHLEESPDDPKANLAWGQHLCLVKNNWKKGLPYLEKSDKNAIQEAARLEKTDPSEGSEQVRVADAWYEVADSEPQLVAFHIRSRYWYQEALPSLRGLAKAKIEKRLKRIDAMVDSGRLASRGGVERRASRPRRSDRPVTLVVKGHTILKGHEATIINVAFSNDGKNLVTVDIHYRCVLWNTSTEQQETSGRPPFRVNLVKFLPGDQNLLYYNGDLNVHVGSIRPFAAPQRIAKHGVYPYADVLPQGSFVVVYRAPTASLSIWSLPGMKGPAECTLPSPAVSLKLLPDNVHVAVGYENGEIGIWDLAKQAQVFTLPAAGEAADGGRPVPRSLCISPDAGRLFAFDASTIYSWDLRTKKAVGSIHVEAAGPIQDLCLSPNGQTLAVAGPNTITLMDARTGKHSATLPKTYKPIAFSPDGSTLVGRSTASADQAMLWHFEFRPGR